MAKEVPIYLIQITSSSFNNLAGGHRECATFMKELVGLLLENLTNLTSLRILETSVEIHLGTNPLFSIMTTPRRMTPYCSKQLQLMRLSDPGSEYTSRL